LPRITTSIKCDDSES